MSAQATRNELAVVTLAEAILKAEWERVKAEVRADLARRLSEIRKATMTRPGACGGCGHRLGDCRCGRAAR